MLTFDKEIINFMGTNDVLINEKIKFVVDDTGLNQLISLLSNVGDLKMDCSWCGLTILPQVRSKFSIDAENEFSVKCVGCGKMVMVRMYGLYGFLLENT